MHLKNQNARQHSNIRPPQHLFDALPIELQELLSRFSMDNVSRWSAGSTISCTTDVSRCTSPVAAILGFGRLF